LSTEDDARRLFEYLTTAWTGWAPQHNAATAASAAASTTNPQPGTVTHAGGGGSGAGNDADSPSVQQAGGGGTGGGGGGAGAAGGGGGDGIQQALGELDGGPIVEGRLILTLHLCFFPSPMRAWFPLLLPGDARVPFCCVFPKACSIPSLPIPHLHVHDSPRLCLCGRCPDTSGDGPPPRPDPRDHGVGVMRAVLPGGGLFGWAYDPTQVGVVYGNTLGAYSAIQCQSLPVPRVRAPMRHMVDGTRR